MNALGIKFDNAMVKNIEISSSLEPKGQWPLDLVCNVVDVGPIQFAQMMNLG